MDLSNINLTSQFFPFPTAYMFCCRCFWIAYIKSIYFKNFNIWILFNNLHFLISYIDRAWTSIFWSCFCPRYSQSFVMLLLRSWGRSHKDTDLLQTFVRLCCLVYVQDFLGRKVEWFLGDFIELHHYSVLTLHSSSIS